VVFLEARLVFPARSEIHPAEGSEDWRATKGK